MNPTLAALIARVRTVALRNAPTPTGTGGWYRIENADSPERATVHLFDEIGWDVLAGEFIAQLDTITAPAIDLHINSPGGAVWDGFAIHNALVQHPARVTSHVVGLAASAASFIAMAADDGVVAYRPSQMMIHRASGFAYGNAADMRELADLLDIIDRELASIYQRKAGGTVDDWLAAMTATTWYGPDEAKAAGLADRIAGDPEPTPTPEPTPPAEDLARREQLVRARARVASMKGARQ